MRHHARGGSVFLRHGSLRLLVVGAQLAENAKIVVATIVEDTSLDVFVSVVGVVIECLQLLFGAVVSLDILVELSLLLHELTADVDG